MDSKKSTNKPNPWKGASFFSKVTWIWTICLFKKGYNKILGIEDLYDPIESDRSNILGDRLEKQWFSELEKSKTANRQPSLTRAIFRAFAFEFCMLGCLVLIQDFVIKLGTPMLLGALLDYFKPDTETPFETALYYATGIVTSSLFSIIISTHYFFLGAYATTKLRISIGSLVYRKALRLSSTVVNGITPGKIVNLVASDVNRFFNIFLLLHYLWSAPLSSVVILGYLYSEIGWSALVGFLFMFLDVPFQSYMGKLFSKFRLKTSLKTDERVRLMDEIISGVQVIKMYAWEKPFCTLIELARRLELKNVRKTSYIKGINSTAFLFTTRMALFGTLTTMMLRGQELTMDKVFMYMSYFNVMAYTMSYMFIRGISEGSECRVALTRVQEFLMNDEFKCEDIIEKDSAENYMEDVDKTIEATELDPFIKHPLKDFQKLNGMNKKGNMVSDGWAIQLENACAKWDLHSSKTTLDDIDVKIDEGKLYVVIGTVGAGKSSFIASILGELKLGQGSKRVNGCISYASQDAWVFGATVRQNITFGQDFKWQKYQDVVKVCALQQDFEQFPQGDQTIVGERGSSLSGGQKARINLARAVYRDADIYLLDDPLSAVDARVSKLLFEGCIQKYLANKTRILATHQLQYIKAADAIILLDQGKLYKYNDYNDLLNSYPEYNNLVMEEKILESIDSAVVKSSRYDGRKSSTSVKSKASSMGNQTVGTEMDDEGNDASDVDIYESSSRGTVKGNLLIIYMKSGTNRVLALIVPVLILATQFCVSSTDWFIPILVRAEQTRNYLNVSGIHIENDLLSRESYVYIYAASVLSILFVGITRSMTFYIVCSQCSQRLHDLAFSALIRAPMRFFNTNSSGRILNRFSKDLGSTDEFLPWTLLDASQQIMIVTGALIVSCTINPIFLVPIILIGVIFYFIRKVYLKTSKNLKRVEGITRAPIFTHLNTTLNGITTIRAYQAQSLLEKVFNRLQDTYISSWFMYSSSNSAFGFYLDFFCFIFIGLVTFSFLLLKDNFNDGVVGLVITQVISLANCLQWGVRQSALVSDELLSVERVLEYSLLEPETNLRDTCLPIKKKKKKGFENDIQLVNPPEDWPSEGQIEFKNVYLRYSDEDQPVLKNLTLTIHPCEKVGIVGRTGAGKSSLISALFRLAKVEGIIGIDGIDTGTIALEDLRKHISIIPQDPVLFSGTLRYNLDPFNEFSDEQLWNVLEEVELKESQQSTGNGLDHRVQDRGSNYSTGQRQLICLARAILRNNRILMLDEATANVDPQTDALIQRTIRTKFAQCTVLTVAHRLNTIMDSDRVLVMDQGIVVEFDHPHLLLGTEYSSFSSLVKETGPSMFEQLKKVAHDAYLDRRNTQQSS